MIELFVYVKSSGLLDYTDFGETGFVISSIPDSHDFTLTPPPSFSNSWKWNGLEWEEVLPIEPPLAPLEDRQDEAWEAIKQRRYEATVSGVYVPSIDKVFHTDATSVIQYNNIGNMIALGNFEPIQWKVKDNTWITLTEEVFKELQTAMVQNTNRIYQVAEEHKAEMMQMDNPEDYDFSEGWDITHPSN